MGCDMYCVVEALNKKSKNWDCFGVSCADRNYSLFSRIADVRNSEKEDTYIEPIDSPRGWPFDNISTPAEAWLESLGLYHSQTWLDRCELESLDKWIESDLHTNLWDRLGFGHLSHFFSFSNGWNKGAFKRYSDIRILFVFTD